MTLENEPLVTNNSRRRGVSTPRDNDKEADLAEPSMTKPHKSVEENKQKTNTNLLNRDNIKVEGYNDDTGIHNRDSLCNRLGVMIVLSLIVLLLLLAALHSTIRSRQINIPLNEVKMNIFRDLNRLRLQTQQEDDFWNEVYHTVDHVVQPSVPPHPQTVLVGVPQGGEMTAICLANRIADAVTEGFGDPRRAIKHDTLLHQSMSVSEHRSLLSEELEWLTDSHVAVIFNLELMPASTATLLHHYSDTQDAPYKRAVFFVTVKMNLHFDNYLPTYLRSVLEKNMQRLWKNDLSPSQITALVSSISSRIVLLKPESKAVTSSLCPV